LSEHTIDLAAAPERALAAVARAADLWGGEWERQGKGGRLRIPVRHGLRRGWAGGEVAAEPLPEGARVRFRVDEGGSGVHTAAVAILLPGAAGALVTVAWPFWPGLIALAPLGAILALTAWFLVSSRLRTSGPDEFLDMVAAAIGEEEVADVEPSRSG
jgi:hypothetical protein